MAEPQLIVFISPDVNYALCLFFCGVHRILQAFVHVRRTRASRLRRSRCFWEARWWKQEARRTFPTQQKHAHAPATHSFPIAHIWNQGSYRTAKLLRLKFEGIFQATKVCVFCSQNSSTCSRCWESLRVSYQPIISGDGGKHHHWSSRWSFRTWGIANWQPVSPADENKHFPHHFSQRGICKKCWQDTSAAQLWIFLWWMFNPWLALRHEWIVHASKEEAWTISTCFFATFNVSQKKKESLEKLQKGFCCQIKKAAVFASAIRSCPACDSDRSRRRRRGKKNSF